MARVSIRKTFAQRNETQNFSLVDHQLCAKKTAVCAIIHKSHFAQNFPIPQKMPQMFAKKMCAKIVQILRNKYIHFMETLAMANI